MTISRGLAELMGGQVRLASSELGQGTTFVVDLPLKPAPGTVQVSGLGMADEESESSDSSETPVLSGRILLAEDGLVNQRLISAILERSGAEVTCAADGIEALKHFDAALEDGAPFDLVLTDVQMPNMDGLALTRALLERDEGLPILALTANALGEDRRRAMEAGCSDYLAKPIDWDLLLRTCARYLQDPLRWAA